MSIADGLSGPLLREYPDVLRQLAQDAAEPGVDMETRRVSQRLFLDFTEAIARVQLQALALRPEAPQKPLGKIPTEDLVRELQKTK